MTSNPGRQDDLVFETWMKSNLNFKLLPQGRVCALSFCWSSCSALRQSTSAVLTPQSSARKGDG